MCDATAFVSKELAFGRIGKMAAEALGSEMFQIVFWSAIGLGVVLAGAVGTLMSMDPTTDTLLYANDPLLKKEF